MCVWNCITDTCTLRDKKKANPTDTCCYTADRKEHKNTVIYTAFLFSVVEHLPHIKNKFIQSQFGECLAMQGRNTIWALGIVDCSPTLYGILFVYLFGVIKNTMMNAYFFQMNNLKGLAADESGNSVLVERLARSERFTVRSSVEKHRGGHLDNSLPRRAGAG